MVFGDLGKKLVLRPTSSQSVAPVKSKMPDGTSCKTKWGYVSIKLSAEIICRIPIFCKQ